MTRSRTWGSLGAAAGVALLVAYAGGCYLGLAHSDSVGAGASAGVGGTVHGTGASSSVGGSGAQGGTGVEGGAGQGGSIGGAGGQGGIAGAGGQGGAVVTVVSDFHLPDVNATSPTYNQLVSPRDYLQQVSAWYFGHST